MATTIRSVPNQPKTPASSFRIPLELKAAAAERAAEEDKTLTDIVIEALERYVAKRPRGEHSSQ